MSTAVRRVLGSVSSGPSSQIIPTEVSYRFLTGWCCSIAAALPLATPQVLPIDRRRARSDRTRNAQSRVVLCGAMYLLRLIPHILPF